MVIDGTGRDYDKIANQKAILQQLGYDCYMIFVNTSLDVALERNQRLSETIKILKNHVLLIMYLYTLVKIMTMN